MKKISSLIIIVSILFWSCKKKTVEPATVYVYQTDTVKVKPVITVYDRCFIVGQINYGSIRIQDSTTDAYIGEEDGYPVYSLIDKNTLPTHFQLTINNTYKIELKINSNKWSSTGLFFKVNANGELGIQQSSVFITDIRKLDAFEDIYTLSLGI